MGTVTELAVVNVAEVEDFSQPLEQKRYLATWRPGLRVADLVPERWRDAPLGFMVNGLHEPDPRRELAPMDTVLLVLRPRASGLFDIAYVLFWSRNIAPILFGLKAPRKSQDQADPVYGWGPIRTNYDPAGMPVPLLFGRHKTGGAVAQVFSRVVGGSPPVSYLFLQLVISAGPIDSIGQYDEDQDALTGADLPAGLTLEDNDAKNFDDVTCWLRLGSMGQAVVPGFETQNTEFPVDLLIDQVTAASGDPPITDWSLGASFDMPTGEEADRGVVNISFPDGLGSFQSDGSIASQKVTLQVRYTELDDVGTPIGSPALVYFGSATSVDVKAKQIAAFSHDLEVTFWDPATFVAPSLSNALRFIRADHHIGSIAMPPAAAPEWSSGTPIDQFTVYAFINCRTSHTSQPLWSMRKSVGIQFRGMVCSLKQGTGAGVSDVSVLWGDGAANDSLDTNGDLVVDDAPSFIAVTYRAGFGVGGQNRVRIYIDGQMISEKSTAVALKAIGSTNPMTLGTILELVPLSYCDVDFDDVRVFKTEKSPDQVLAAHNDGAWLSGQATEGGLVLGFHNDQVAGTLSPDYLPGAADMVLSAPSGTLATLVAVPGFVTDIADNTVKRARYRVEVQRLDVSHPNSTSTKDAAHFGKLITILDDELRHPGTAMVCLKIKATDQLSGSQPTVGIVAKGVLVPVWDGINPAAPTFTSQWSDNPAWCAAYMLLDELNGGGELFSPASIDWPSMLAWANACAVEVYDQRGQFDSTALAYGAPTLDFPTGIYKLRLASPRPPHFVIDKRVRLQDVDAGALADGFPAADLTIQQIVDVSDTEFELWCPWPAGLAAASPMSFSGAAGTVLGIEPKHSFNAVLSDRDNAFWDQIQQVGEVGRAAIMRLGDKVRIAYDGPRSPVAVISAANIKAGTLVINATSMQDAFNAAVGEIQDEAMGWERNSIPREHPSLEADASTVKRRTKPPFDLRGITRASEAIRQLDFLLNRAHDLVLGCEFECGIDQAFLEPLDVFVLAHPIARFNFGGRAFDDSDNDLSLVVDVPVLVGSKNLLGKTAELSDAGYWQRVGGTPPTMDSAVEVGPDSEPTAFAFTFQGAGASVLRQARALPAGVSLTASIYAKVLTGGACNLNLNCDNGASSLALPDDGAWHRVSAVLTRGAVDWLDVEVATAGSHQIGLQWAQLERGAVATDYVGVDVPTDPTTWGAAVRDSEQDVVRTVPLAASAGGQYQAGETVDLGAELLAGTEPRPPKKGDPWALGAVETASELFSVTDTSLAEPFTRKVQAVQYKASVYPDDNAYGDMALSAAGLQATPASQAVSATLLPEAVVALAAYEEARDDQDSGALTRAIAVNWVHESATASRVERTAVWLQEQDSAEPPLQIGEVLGAGTFFRIVEGPGLRLTSGTSYRISVQPIVRGGHRRGLARCRSTTLTLFGYFPVPQGAPTDGAVQLHGDQATYRATLPARFQNKVLEFWRGGPFIGQLIGRVPVGQDSLGPTYDWCQLPTAADGRGNIPIVARLVSPAGAKGDYVRVASDLQPEGFGDPLLEASFEDGPFDTAPAGFSIAPMLTNLVLADPAPGMSAQRLEFTGTDLVATYESTVFDVGTARRLHVSAGFSGIQDPPDTLAGLPDIGTPAMRAWTPEGFTDPNHPDYAAVQVVLEWATSSTSSDPGTDYRPFRPGLAYLRSCRFRISLTRPTSDWQARIDRMAASLRPLLADEATGGGAPEEFVFGNATDTVYVINHGLGTRDLVCSIVEDSSPWELVGATIEATTVDSVTVRLAAPPGFDALRLVILQEATAKSVAPFGDGVSTDIVVTHGLGTRNILWAIRQAASPYAFVDATVEATDADSLTIRFSVAPAANEFVLVAIGAALGKVATVFGDGVATLATLQHGLDDQGLIARVRESSTPWAFVGATIAAVEPDQATVETSTAPAAGGLIAILSG